MLRYSIAFCFAGFLASVSTAARPNILIAISDDQSFPHASAYGDPAVRTPAFDRVARAGVLFRNAFTPAPGCSPMRAALLTGREIWQNREAGTHASFFPRDLPVFTEQLSDAGYHVGMTGKGWAPGKAIGWPHNPAGKSYAKKKNVAPKGVSRNDYAANFIDFLDDRDGGEPFCFWFGASEPHRGYDKGIGRRNGIDPAKIAVPPFLPDSDEVRSDIADYLFEIQWFDSHLTRMLDYLDQKGELENTLVIVTSDNGMPFPRAKANLYEFGIHMPLAIAWPARIAGGQQTDDLVSLIDLTQTIFDASNVSPKMADQLSGRSLLPRYAGQSNKSVVPRDAVFSGRERHSSSRFSTLGYPCRCIRTQKHLYIRNFKPERWPAGTPQKYDKAVYDSAGKILQSKLGDPHGGYHDIDDGPTLRWMIANRTQVGVANLFAAAVDVRPPEELYDIQTDPGCLNNLASSEIHAVVKDDLARRLTSHLRKTGDLRVTDPEAANVWETYPRVSSLRWFPVPLWAGENPGDVPPLEWMEKRRPRP